MKKINKNVPRLTRRQTTNGEHDSPSLRSGRDKQWNSLIMH